jgi:hypothetical protein
MDALRISIAGLASLISASAFAAVLVNTAGELEAAVDQANAGGDPEIVLRDGVYDLERMLWVSASGVMVRSESGDRDAVSIRGQGPFGAVTHVFNVAGSGFVARDLTLGNVSQHAVQLQPDVDDVRLSNLHIRETGEQMVKVAYDSQDLSATSDRGLLENSLLEYAEIGPQFYIGGIDAHNAVGWVVRDNTFRNIRSPAGSVAEHAVHFWSGSRDTLVERNMIVDCDRGIGFGFGGRGHGPGIIRNNMIFNGVDDGFADVGIGLESATAVEVYNNTVVLLSGYPNAIEYRFTATSDGLIANNLTNTAIISRDGGTAALQDNVTSASPGWFEDARTGDLHLAEAIAGVVDQGAAITGLLEDFDQDPRPEGMGIDIGADERRSPPDPSCSASGPVVISDRAFAPGTATRCRSEVQISTQGDVSVAPSASLTLESPTIRLAAGFHVQLGGIFRVGTGPTADRLTPADFVYEGAFRLPESFNWGARGASFYPPGDLNAGSLLVLGFEADPAVFAEVSIPAPQIEADWRRLPMATLLTPMAEFDGALIERTACGAYTFAGDLQYVPRRGSQTGDKLYGAALCWYPEGAYGDDNFPTVWMSALDGSQPRGLFQVGPDSAPFHGNKTGAYLFSVPQWYADRYLGGRTLVTGKSRGTPHGSQGPALVAFYPWQVEAPSGNLDARMMLYYRFIYPECAGPNLGDKASCDYPDFTMCDAWSGGAFVEHNGRSAIILAGIKGLGDNRYGPAQPGDCDSSQGYHCDPYERQILFYDIEQVGAAAVGQRDLWSVVPYAIWRPDAFFLRDAEGQTCGTLGGVTVDAQSGRVYVVERGFGENDENAAVVHAWGLGD